MRTSTLLLLLIISLYTQAQGDFVSIIDEVIKTAPPPRGTQLRTTANVNVRATPSLNGRVLTTLSTGATVESLGEQVVAEGHTWYGIKGVFGTGYASSIYLQVVTGDRRINTEGLELVKHFEGYNPCRYICPAGIPTICWGHTKNVPASGCLTRDQCEGRLREDMTQFERCVKNGITVNLTDNQFSALVSFSFNIGCGAFNDSTLRILLNRGQYNTVCEQLKRWIYGGGVILPGLVRRREAECNLFNKR